VMIPDQTVVEKHTHRVCSLCGREHVTAKVCPACGGFWHYVTETVKTKVDIQSLITANGLDKHFTVVYDVAYRGCPYTCVVPYDAYLRIPEITYGGQSQPFYFDMEPYHLDTLRELLDATGVRYRIESQVLTYVI
jgi:hypothetical protein